MPLPWIVALKVFNEGKSAWCVPKKGGAEYAEVKAIQDRTSPAKTEARNAERRTKAMEQLKSIDTRAEIERKRAARPKPQSAMSRAMNIEDLQRVVRSFAGPANPSFKDIYVTFLKNVLAGEPAKHTNRELKHSEDGEKYHAWQSTVSYPVVSEGMGDGFEEVEVGNVRLELGYDEPLLAPTWKPDAEVSPLTPIRVLIVSLDKKIGKMSPKDALTEAIRVLEGASVPKPDGVLFGKQYTKAKVLTILEDEMKRQYPSVYDTTRDEQPRLRDFADSLRSDETIRAYLKHKKVKGITAKTTPKTLRAKLVLPTVDDIEFLATLKDRGRPFADPLTPSGITAALARMKALGKSSL